MATKAHGTAHGRTWTIWNAMMHRTLTTLSHGHKCPPTGPRWNYLAWREWSPTLSCFPGWAQLSKVATHPWSSMGQRSTHWCCWKKLNMAEAKMWALQLMIWIDWPLLAASGEPLQVVIQCCSRPCWYSWRGKPIDLTVGSHLSGCVWNVYQHRLAIKRERKSWGRLH